MKERMAIIEGWRTPFCKAGTDLASISADDLGAFVVREMLNRIEFNSDEIDELIFGNVGQPVNAPNIARVVALKAGLNQIIPAYTVHRNCASGMESITTAANKILAGQVKVVVAGGTESMSNYPLLYNKPMSKLFSELMRAKSPTQKLSTLLSFRPHYLKPVIAVMEGLTDPICSLNMGQTAEVLAKEFNISRQHQDEFALQSHVKAAKAQADNIFLDEILNLPHGPDYKTMVSTDNGIRVDQTLEALKKLRPIFDRQEGTVTAGNACPISDGAASVLMMSESEAKKRGLNPLGYVKDYAYAGLEPHRMGLGPVYATAKLFGNNKMTMKDIDLVELNEAFSVQVLANQMAFDSTQFAQDYLNRSHALGAIDDHKLNINGGAIALGHPVGTTGTRIIITLLKALKRGQKNVGLATLCIGGGQGGAVLLEVE